MKCKSCSEKAVLLKPKLCKKHFFKYFEKRVYDTIKEHKLISKKDKVCVAVSGGKDSLVTLHLLNKKFDVTGLAIDEGIKGYRKHTLDDLKKFCKEHKIKLNVVSFEKEFGYSLDKLLKKLKVKPCTACGILRRYLLNKFSRKFDLIATGHNLDDEAQSIAMNYLRNNLEVGARLGLKSGLIKDKNFTPRVKPLYFCPEKEIMLYSFLKRIQTNFVECPYATESYRNFIREKLNEYENEARGSKAKIVKGFLKILPKLKKSYLEKYSNKQSILKCAECKEPSKQEICSKCLLLKKL
jgi:tRNA-5-methyluridine54 2-sulfurtransferase